MSETNTNQDLVSAALVAAQGEMQPAEFDSTNPFLRNRYASLGAVIEASRQVLAKHKLALIQVPNTPDPDTVAVSTRIIHASGQWIDGGTLKLALGDEKGKSRAQVAGSIVTYLRRYAWSSVLGMYAEEDTDGNGHEPQKNPVVAPTRAQPSTPAPPTAPLTVATSNTRAKALSLLEATDDQPNRAMLTDYLRRIGWLGPDKEVEQWPYRFVPITKEELEQVKLKLNQYKLEGRAERPYAPHGMDPSSLPTPTVKVPEKAISDPATPIWASFVMTVGPKKGCKLANLPVADLEFYWLNFQPKEQKDVQQADGSVETIKFDPKQFADQKALRAMLDLAGKELGFKVPEQKEVA